MFDVIFNGLASVMSWFYSLVPDYTFAICMLTLAIMLVFTPLTLRGARAMTKTQGLQPEMTRLRKQYAGDRQKINEEMMKLYQAHGVSPLGGCLPNLVQLPIFFVLYRVIWNLRIPEDNTSDNPFPRNLSSDSELYRDLVEAGGEMPSLGMDLAQSVWDVLTEASDIAGFIEGSPYLGLVAITFILAWLQQRQMAKRRAGGPAMPNRQMELMMKYMPFMLPLFSFIVPAALIPYFIVSSLYRMLQQAFIHATMKPPQPLTDGVIEAETVDEPEATPTQQVPNQRSRKALDAEAARQAERERRSAERANRSKPPPQHAPDNRVTDGSADDPPQIRRTRSSAERVTDAGKRARKGSYSKDAEANRKRGRRRGRTEAKDGPKPIQSRRTSGDGRTRNRRKR